MLAAGLEGIENNYELLEFENKNEKLPSNLWEAILITENSEFIFTMVYVFQF